ncbi:hypothetical protein QP363_12430 [Corynebacterium sp. UMB6689]|uniref:hypothetical protein n=1 Tax=Corynebacterium sp. UMB6689 TaxID=3046341 RepID=UPI00254F22A6|nr:hypothetical protein [Corynebacterium sp. UMB6689]MDK6814787.1 hypothetical protein [Corynebacterium sp. UMB6689]
MRGKYIDNTDVANLIIQDWWFADGSAPEDEDQDQDQGNQAKDDTSSKVGSSIGAGFLGAGIAAAILGTIATYLQSMGIVKVDFAALQRMFR